jgi:hypothetical protein
MESTLIPPIICIAPVEWHGLRQRPQVLMEYFREKTQVFYLDPVGLRSARLSDIRRMGKKLLHTACKRKYGESLKNIEIVTPWYVPFEWAPRINDIFFYRLARKIKETCRKKVIVWIGSPSPLAIHMLNQLDYALSVYDCMDDFPAFHNNSKNIYEHEKQILKRVDIVLTASNALYDKVLPNARRVLMAPNGVDLRRFHQFPDAVERPKDLPSGKTIIGYHGIIGEWFDLELICRLAQCRPKWKFVLIGPKAMNIKRSTVPHNVIFLGQKPHDMLPMYVSFFDVGIIPFTESQVSYHSNPIKAYEYLAMGVPVVSTPIAELMHLKEVVYTASGYENFLQGIEYALDQAHSENRVKERLSVAEAHSWDMVFEKIFEKLVGLDFFQHEMA